MKALYTILSCVLLLHMSNEIYAGAPGNTPGQEQEERIRILFVLDASKSMTARWGLRSMMDGAKEVLAEMADTIRRQPNVEIALRVYGHMHDISEKNCRDTRLEVGFSRGNYVHFRRRLDRIQPRGLTPIALSLEQVANDFPESENSRNIVILISDGIETCDGNPCDVSQQLQEKGIILKPYVIGLGSDPQLRALDCVGFYYQAPTANDFRNILREIFDKILINTSVQVNLLNEQKRPLETDVNLTFINRSTKKGTWKFLSHLKCPGKP